MKTVAIKARNRSFAAVAVFNRQRELIELLQNHPLGLTAWELADITGHYVHAVRPRLTELSQEGTITGEKTKWQPRTKREETVWRLAA